MALGDRIALRDVRVFDGQGLTEPRTVVIDGAVIGSDDTGAEVIDAAGGFLLPGLIDAHIHPTGRDTLVKLASYGVTTGFDMGIWSPQLLAELRDSPGLTDIRSSGTPVIGPGGLHAQVPGLAEVAAVRDPEHARRFVADRVAEGASHLKVIVEPPGGGGPELTVIRAVVAAAHEHGLPVVAHATLPEAYTMALDAGVDVITHVPLGRPIAEADLERLAAGRALIPADVSLEDAVAEVDRGRLGVGRVVVPTLVMMEGVSRARGVSEGFAAALQSVGGMYAAGVPILAGSDSNAQRGIPFNPPFGESLHRELELLVEAGLSTAAALRAATSLPAEHFGLADRGVIAPGLRADLVLLDADPLADIRATRSIRRVWVAGTEHEPAPAEESG